MCQVSKKAIDDVVCVPIDATDFVSGGMLVNSYALPGKLFSAYRGLLIRTVGMLTPESLKRVNSAVTEILRVAEPR